MMSWPHPGTHPYDVIPSEIKMTEKFDWQVCTLIGPFVPRDLNPAFWLVEPRVAPLTTIKWSLTGGWKRNWKLWNRHPHKWSIAVAYGFHTFTSVCFSQQPSIHNSNCYFSVESLHNGYLRTDGLVFWGEMGLIWEVRKEIRVEKIYPSTS